MKLKDEIVALLPNRICRVIAMATLILPPVTYGVCPDLFASFPKLSESNKLLIRLLLAESVALFGLLCLVASLISYNHKRPKAQKLNTSSEQVLLTFFKEECQLSVLHFERLCIFQGINSAQYYLDELLERGYITITGGTNKHPDYSITEKGRKYVMENIQNRT